MLEKIQIASPCKANWEQMAGDERVRYCAECDLDVYNFSVMHREEVERIVREREGRLCARFFQRPDGTMLTQDCPVGFRARVRRVSRVAGAAVAAALSAMPAWAQTTKPSQSSLVQIESNNAALALRVIDPSGAVVPGAEVLLFLENNKTPIRGETDKRGEARFDHLKPAGYAVLARHAGFHGATKTLTIAAKSTAQLEIVAMLMGVVVEVPTPIARTETQDSPPAKIPYVPMPRSSPKK